MFGKKKKEERLARERQQRLDQEWSSLDAREMARGGYYRQDEYYTQQTRGMQYDPRYQQQAPRRDGGYDARLDDPDAFYRQNAGGRSGYMRQDGYARQDGPMRQDRYTGSDGYGYSERPADDARFEARGRGPYRQDYSTSGSEYDRVRMERRRQAQIERSGRVGKTVMPDSSRRGGRGGGRVPSQGYYYQPKRRRRWWKFLLELILILVLALGVLGFAALTRIDRNKLKELIVNSGITGKAGYTTLVFYGVDSRTGELTKDTHSDSIMICVLNRRSKEVRIASVYRDTYLDNTNGEYRKATECYFYGGPQRSINMLNKNLDLDIRDYVAVNFNAVIKAIDLVGGIDLEITEEERNYINGYCVETSQVTGVPYEDLYESGYVHLNGIQAMAYCRIRYTEGWDFKRTERQRTVLTLAYQKAMQKGPAAILSIVNTMLPSISTSMSNVEILELAAGIGSYKIGSQTGFPFNQASANLSAGDCVVPVNLASNVTQLHEFLYDETGYVPSETVQAISSEIANATGIY